ncbi:unnamed protein product [Mycena citricolor]|uniref:Carboxylic ester hydrolase n=1 Tax=Mycena citricolor TaxID=2018698 RepID=A0AAD2GYJ3_9AGAR|nr:unnamed protein product [Mycena citricolor]
MDLGLAVLSLTRFLANNALAASWLSSTQNLRCAALKDTLRVENTTVVEASFLPAGSTIPAHESCPYSSGRTATPLCRVQFVTQTSEGSSIRAEAWLPDEWHGRFLGVGNGALGGCINYADLAYGSALHFAAVGSNNGHDGNSGEAFFLNPEVVEDFAHRSIHVEAVVGKQITEAYYGQPHRKAFYLGCSTGGRQGTQEALMYPEDFDGILAGAPATDFNHLLHWSGMLSRYIGAPGTPTFLSARDWKLVAEEILHQCDMLDGIRDGIITEPDACLFRPDVLACSTRAEDVTCLSPEQVEVLHKIYSPLYDNGTLIYPRVDPGVEMRYARIVLSGTVPRSLRDWFRFAVINDTAFDFGTYGPEHGRLMDAVNPGGVATFSGNLTAFRDRGGKFLTFHGRMDGLITSGNSKRMYDLVSQTLDMSTLDPFYRLFLVPGLGHCTGGLGSPNFGQSGEALPSAVNASSHNLLLALVDWVENGVGPEHMVGTSDDGKRERIHCRYPMSSVWAPKQRTWLCM